MFLLLLFVALAKTCKAIFSYLEGPNEIPKLLEPIREVLLVFQPAFSSLEFDHDDMDKKQKNRQRREIGVASSALSTLSAFLSHL